MDLWIVVNTKKEVHVCLTWQLPFFLTIFNSFFPSPSCIYVGRVIRYTYYSGIYKINSHLIVFLFRLQMESNSLIQSFLLPRFNFDSGFPMSTWDLKTVKQKNFFPRFLICPFIIPFSCFI